MVAIVDRVRLGVCLGSQQKLVKLLNCLRKFFGALNNEGEANESARVLYLVSLTFFISLILLSPDKILQTLESGQVSAEMFGKAHDVIRLFRRIVPI